MSGPAARHMLSSTLIAPRPLFVESGEKDNIFPVAASIESFKNVRDIFKIIATLRERGLTLLHSTAQAAPGKVRIDLVRLSETDCPESAILQRYVSMVQMRRGDFNGKVLTIRSDDIRALASVLEQSPEALVGRLEGLGLKATIVH